MNDFLLFIDDLAKRFPVHVKIYYNKIASWSIYVYKAGCAKDFPHSKHDGEDAILRNVQSYDITIAFAKALVDVKYWLLENNGGY